MRGRRGEGSFALVATLLIVAVMALGALAFFLAARTDRLTSRNTADRVRAELAAESGLAAAMALLQAGTSNDHFLIVLNPTNRQLFCGNGSNQPAGSFAYQPLFSGASDLAGTVTSVVTNGVPNFSSAASTNLFTNMMPGGLAVTSPAVAWVIQTNAAGVTNARFAFWIEDLGGRLDLSVAGSTGTNAQRPTGTNPSELALWSLFNPAAAGDTNNAVVASLLSARTALLTPASARLVNSNSVTSNLLADLATGLMHDTNEPEVIPFGFGYGDAGNLKIDLNTATATTIASTINNNLPDFSDRAGGLNATTYVNQIAANVVDYRDSDSVPTQLGSAIGIDSYPYITELTVLYRLVRTTGNGASTSIVLSREPFVELWNFTDRPFDGELEISVTCNDNLVNFLGQPSPFSQTTTLATNYATAPLPAGAYRAVALPANEVSVPFGGSTTPPNNRRIAWASTNQGGSFEVRLVRGADKFLVQSSLGGFERRANSVYGVTGDALPLNDSTHMIYRGQINMGGAGSVELLGDLRSHSMRSGFRAADLTTTLLWPTYPTGTHHGGQSSFGGRNPGISWTSLMEGVRDTPAGRNPGNNLTGLRTPPTAVVPQAPDTNNVLQKIRNGSMESATELGRIYDPCLWNWPLGSSDIPTNATSHPNRGGGNTLRIGRNEHPKFSTNGQVAHQLLDLFAATTNPPGPGGSVTMKIPGKINLNTATTNALRALVAGVTHRNDPDQQPSSLVVNNSTVERFIQGVAEARTAKPFFSAAELSNLTNAAGEGVFGNATSLAVTDWNDAGTEEWFSRIHHLSAVRSRNFLIHVIGQAMRTNQSSTPISSSRIVVQVYMSPQRSANGLTTNSQVLTLNRWSL